MNQFVLLTYFIVSINSFVYAQGQIPTSSAIENLQGVGAPPTACSSQSKVSRDNLQFLPYEELMTLFNSNSIPKDEFTTPELIKMEL